MAGQLIERGGYVGDRLVAAVERRTQDRHNPDGVLITAGHGLFRVKMKTLTAHRHDPRFNVPVATKLLPTDLEICAHDQVRAAGAVNGSGGPASVKGYSGEHALSAVCGVQAGGYMVGGCAVPYV